MSEGNDPEEVHEDTTTLHASFNDAMLAVMREVRYIKKVKATGLQYPIVTEEEVLNICRPAMIRHGMTISPKKVVCGTEEAFKTSGGSTQRSIRIIVTFRVAVSIVTGECEERDVAAIGEGCDSMDKATGKAMTSALKYALRQMFCLPSGMDPDRYASQPIAQIITGESPEVMRRYLHVEGAIKAADTEKRLDEFLAYAESSQSLFSEDQIVVLGGVAEDRRQKIRGKNP